MTDIKSHLSSAFGEEPPLADDLDAVMTTGRRALGRHNRRTAVFGTAGVAVLTAAVVVPIVAAEGHSAPAHVTIAPLHHAPKAKPKCKSEFFLGKHGNLDKHDLKVAKTKLGTGTVHVHVEKKANGQEFVMVSTCTNAQQIAQEPAAERGPTGPKYHYTEAPTAIASRLGGKLASDVAGQNLTVVYTRPFAQESSTLEKGHPSYYAGNVDVQVGSTLGDIGVQVNHPTTTQQPFDGTCDGTGFAQCQRTTLADGDVLQTDRVKVGHGTFILEAQVSRTDGTLVQVQESNYAFGPEATKAYGDQPLPLSALVTMAEDSSYSF